MRFHAIPLVNTTVATCLLLSTAEVVVQSFQDDEKFSNAVAFTIYLYSSSAWDTSGRSIVANTVAEEANSYCKENYEDCCLYQNWTTSTSSFIASDFDDNFDGYPASGRADFEVKFAVKIPTSLIIYQDISCSPYYYLKKTISHKLLENSRNVVAEKTGHYIILIEEQSYVLPPNSTLNYILTPASFGALILLIIILLILKRRCKLPPEAVNKTPITPATSMTTTMTPSAVEMEMQITTPVRNVPSLENGGITPDDDTAEKQAPLSQNGFAENGAKVEQNLEIGEHEKELAHEN